MSKAIINFIVSSDGQDYHISIPGPPCDWNNFFEELMDHLAFSTMDTPLYYFDSDNNKHPIVDELVYEILMDQTDSDSDLSYNTDDMDDLTVRDFADTINGNDNIAISSKLFDTDDTLGKSYNTIKDDPSSIDHTNKHNHRHDSWYQDCEHGRHRQHHHHCVKEQCRQYLPHYNLKCTGTSMDSTECTYRSINRCQKEIMHGWRDQCWKRASLRNRTPV